MATARTGNPPGRPRKPAALQVLHGDRKDRRRVEPKIGGTVEKPELLSEPASALWDDTAPHLIAAGVLTRVDVPLFAEFCEAVVVARVARVKALSEAAGRTTVQPGAVSPTSIWSKSMSIVNALGSQFGMTPAARARLASGETSGATDDLLSG